SQFREGEANGGCAHKEEACRDEHDRRSQSIGQGPREPHPSQQTQLYQEETRRHYPPSKPIRRLGLRYGNQSDVVDRIRHSAEKQEDGGRRNTPGKSGKSGGEARSANARKEQ